MTEYIPYTYLIGWTSLNKYYYGVEYSIKTKIANPKNFWCTYFTSSNIVKQFRDEFGEPNIIKIRKIFNKGSEFERMQKAIEWEKKVLQRVDITKDIWLNGRIGGDICPANLVKISRLKYGVDNVFQAESVKQKIKKTNLERYGVEHPSHSKKLLKKRSDNLKKRYEENPEIKILHQKNLENSMLEKYGVKNPLQSEKIKSKIRKTNMKRYGVEWASQSKESIEKILKTRNNFYNRYIVKHIKEYSRVFGIKLKEGFYQSSDEKLTELLNILKKDYGDYSLEYLVDYKPRKRHQLGIFLLQERSIVKTIRKYKDLYKLSLGRLWDRKSEKELKLVLDQLILKYGHL